MSMLSTITLLCRATKDIELRQTQNGEPYVRLDLAQTKGYGDKEHSVFYTGWLKGAAAQRIVKAGVKKGSLIYLTGDLEPKTYTAQDGTSRMSLNIDVLEWGYVPSPQKKDDTPASTPPAATPYGTQVPAPAPQYNQYANNMAGAPPAVAPQFEELGDDDELPF